MCDVDQYSQGVQARARHLRTGGCNNEKAQRAKAAVVEGGIIERVLGREITGGEQKDLSNQPWSWGFVWRCKGQEHDTHRGAVYIDS